MSDLPDDWKCSRASQGFLAGDIEALPVSLGKKEIHGYATDIVRTGISESQKATQDLDQ